MNNEAPQGTRPEDEYEIYRKQKHEKWQTPEEIIDAAVLEAASSPLKEKTRLVKGESNEVYSAITESGQEIIIRIYHGKKGRFEKERWAFDRCAEAGIPVPTMLSIESVENEGELLHICVETKLDGTDLGDVSGITDSEKAMELAGYLHQLGAAFEKVHAVKTNGFGSLDKDGNGKFRSVKELISEDLYIKKDYILAAFDQDTDTRVMLISAFDILEREAATYPEIEPRLIHNDLSPQHVLVKDGKITGIIDFESAVGGDPVMEFALWEFKHGREFPTKLLEEGYVDQSLFGEDFERKLNFWKIYRSLTSLRYCLDEKKRNGIKKSLKSLQNSVRFFAQSGL